MFKKRVTIFGRSIPLAAVLLAVVVVAVGAWAAVFLLIPDQPFSMTSSVAPTTPIGEFTEGSWVCSIVGSGSQVGDCTDLSAVTWRADISPDFIDVDDTTYIHLENMWQNLDTQDHEVVVTFVGLSPDIVVTHNLPLTVASLTTSPMIEFDYDLTGVSGNTVYTFDVVFSIEALP